MRQRPGCRGGPCRWPEPRPGPRQGENLFLQDPHAGPDFLCAHACRPAKRLRAVPPCVPAWPQRPADPSGPMALPAHGNRLGGCAPIGWRNPPRKPILAALAATSGLDRAHATGSRLLRPVSLAWRWSSSCRSLPCGVGRSRFSPPQPGGSAIPWSGRLPVEAPFGGGRRHGSDVVGRRCGIPRSSFRKRRQHCRCDGDTALEAGSCRPCHSSSRKASAQEEGLNLELSGGGRPGIKRPGNGLIGLSRIRGLLPVHPAALAAFWPTVDLKDPALPGQRDERRYFHSWTPQSGTLAGLASLDRAGERIAATPFGTISGTPASWPGSASALGTIAGALGTSAGLHASRIVLGRVMTGDGSCGLRRVGASFRRCLRQEAGANAGRRADLRSPGHVQVPIFQAGHGFPAERAGFPSGAGSSIRWFLGRALPVRCRSPTPFGPSATRSPGRRFKAASITAAPSWRKRIGTACGPRSGRRPDQPRTAHQAWIRRCRPPAPPEPAGVRPPPWLAARGPARCGRPATSCARKFIVRGRRTCRCPGTSPGRKDQSRGGLPSRKCFAQQRRAGGPGDQVGKAGSRGVIGCLANIRDHGMLQCDRGDVCCCAAA